MSDKPNIHEHVAAICETLGLVAKNVKQLIIAPTSVIATVYAVNEDGSKYVDPDLGVIAEQHTFQVIA